MPSAPYKEMISVSDAMARLGVSKSVIYRAIDAGELPAYRVGKIIRLDPADVDALVRVAKRSVTRNVDEHTELAWS